jgi:acetyltransferase-like isoleucine patch superfamily enzyme
MKILYWVLADEKNSRTSALNRVLYERSLDGRSLAQFSHPQLNVGEYTYGLGRECFISYHPDDRVQIGKFCSIADGVKFVFGEHRTNAVSTFPLRAMCFGGEPHADARSKGDIVVGHDVWIGVNAIILSGVKIGNGAVIAAGSVVCKNVPPYSVCGGVPAKVIKMRFPENQITALEKLQWWDWPIEKIKANAEDFYGDVETFIKRYSPENNRKG